MGFQMLIENQLFDLIFLLSLFIGALPVQRTNPRISSNFQRYQQQSQLNARHRLNRQQVERFEISNNKGANNLSVSISEYSHHYPS